MAIIVQLDVMLARRKMRSRELAERIGITAQNLSLLKSGKVRGVRFDTLSRSCEALQCQPGDLLVWQADQAGAGAGSGAGAGAEAEAGAGAEAEADAGAGAGAGADAGAGAGKDAAGPGAALP